MIYPLVLLGVIVAVVVGLMSIGGSALRKRDE